MSSKHDDQTRKYTKPLGTISPPLHSAGRPSDVEPHPHASVVPPQLSTCQNCRSQNGRCAGLRIEPNGEVTCALCRKRGITCTGVDAASIEQLPVRQKASKSPLRDTDDVSDVSDQSEKRHTDYPPFKRRRFVPDFNVEMPDSFYPHLSTPVEGNQEASISDAHIEVCRSVRLVPLNTEGVNIPGSYILKLYSADFQIV